jgi:hypothetical protein
VNKFKPLPIPSDSAWDRKTWRSYAPSWFLNIVDGIKNIIRWIPILYKDRDWDDSYIFEILKKKLYFQREYLVKANRHTDIPTTNRYITICLNLIEAIQEESYGVEYQDFEETKNYFVKCKDNPEHYEWKTKTISEKHQEYFNKYKLSYRKIKGKSPDEDNHTIAFRIAQYNQEKCKRLLFNILNRHIEGFWD